MDLIIIVLTVNGGPPAAGADLLVALIFISFHLFSKPVDSLISN